MSPVIVVPRIIGERYLVGDRPVFRNAGGSGIVDDGGGGGEPPPTAFDDGYTYTDHTVPTGAGWTDGSDCRSALQAFLNGIPSGASSTSHRRILFPAGFTWRISGNLVIGGGKAHWTIEGGGTETLRGHSGGAVILRQGGLARNDTAGGHFSVSHWDGTAGYRATDIRFHCITLRGDSDRHSTAVSDLPAYAAGISFRSCDGARVSHCVMEQVRGDLIYVAAAQSSTGGTPSRDILIDGNLLARNDRMGVATVNHTGTLTVRGNEFRDIFYAAFDDEPNSSSSTIGDILIEENLFAGTMSWGTSYNDGIIKADSQNTNAPSHAGTFTIRDNTFDCAVLNNNGQGIMFAASFGALFVKSGALLIENNVSLRRFAGPIVRTANWSGGVTMRNNSGWLSSGSFYQDSGGNGSIVNTGNS